DAENADAESEAGEGTARKNGLSVTPRWPLLSLDRNQSSTVGLLELDSRDGHRIRDTQLKKENILYIKGQPGDGAAGTPTVAVLLDQPELDRKYVAGLNRQGEVLWRAQLPKEASRSQLEPIACGDLNGDLIPEWLVVSSNGTIIILNDRGEQLDRFQYGAEVTGLCTVAWGDSQTALVITDPDRITAWSISGKKSPQQEENQPASNEPERTDTK
ncbi:MAG: hypothetical protein Q4G68_14855, partial [Planctomycetia bacterium]|nr:hypothetical protein [Planctomycetia bacterium]